MNGDLRRMLEDWKDGKELRLLKLGHSRHFRQQRAYACAFAVISNFLESAAPIPETIEEVNMVAESIALQLELTEEERGGATSFAWLALRNGWASTLAGHADHKYIMLTREAEAA